MCTWTKIYHIHLFSCNEQTTNLCPTAFSSCLIYIIIYVYSDAKLHVYTLVENTKFCFHVELDLRDTFISLDFLWLLLGVCTFTHKTFHIDAVSLPQNFIRFVLCIHMQRAYLFKKIKTNNLWITRRRYMWNIRKINYIWVDLS